MWLRQQTPAAPRVLAGPGDDCAVVEVIPDRAWLVTTDMMLEGSHFVLAEVGPRRVGHKAMAVNLSDIAAMGGRPVAAFVSVGLPRGNAETVAEELYLGIREVADSFETAIAGGDTNTWTGGLVVSRAVIGAPGPQGPVPPPGPQPRGWLFVPRPLGCRMPGKPPPFLPPGI